jgi:predicted alpha/beta-hydrolase family hydrolase
VLGHGAGGSVDARDLVATRDVALPAGFCVVLVEQPYRVAGRRAPAPARRLDAAWTAVVQHLTADTLRDLPLVVGGRSSGARVACRTAHVVGATAVLCLAFPRHAPRRRDASGPVKTRLPELDGVLLPTLVVQGASDPFGIPPTRANRRVVEIAGNHSLTTDLDAVATAVGDWLPGVAR